MKKSPYGPAYPALLALSAVFALGAIITLIPNSLAPWPNILGYKSICPFAPGATFGCALLAALTCVIRARLIRRAPSPVFVPVIVIAAILVGLGVSTFRWAGEKVKYAEAVSGASAAE